MHAGVTEFGGASQALVPGVMIGCKGQNFEIVYDFGKVWGP